VLAVRPGLEGPLVGADIAEFNPAQEASGVTAALSA
jgi:arginase family enzyme